MILTKNDKDLLEIICNIGGYIRVKYLKYLYPGLSEKTFFHKLNRLYKLGFLTKRKFITESKLEAATYQITQSGCNLCGKINSIRRVKSVEYAYRSLLKSTFLLENFHIKNYLVSDIEEKKYIFETAGFNTIYVPKTNKSYNKKTQKVSLVQFEEPFFDFRNMTGKELKYNGELLYNDDLKRVIIIHIDQNHVEIKKQIPTLVNRYIMMIKQNFNENIGFKIEFLVVVDNEKRYKDYQVYLKKYIVKSTYYNIFSNMLLELYEQFYKKLAKKDNKYIDKYKSVLNENNEGILKEKLLSRAKLFKSFDSNRTTFVKEQIRQNGIRFVTEEVYNIVKTDENNLDIAMNNVEKLFDIMAYLEYKNEIYLDNEDSKLKYNIKLYKTEFNIYDNTYTPQWSTPIKPSK